MISQKSIQQILDTARVEDVVGEFVNLKRAGSNLKGLCPFHNEKTPSFSVSPSKNIYKCFGCGKGGDAVSFLKEHEQMSYPEALRHLAAKYNIEIEETETSAEYKQERLVQESLFILNEYAGQYFQQQLFETDLGRSVGLSYFKNRGYREDTIRQFGLGFAGAGKNTFTLKATQDGHKLDMLQKLGLTSQHQLDFFRNRVIFPIHNMTGKLIAFAGRILQKDVKAPKYINSPETEIYFKSKVLYGAYFAKKAIRKEDQCILVEGYTDVISLHQAGIENVVASSGTSLTVGQIQLIKRYTPNMCILYDGDAAGIKAALRGLDLVLEQDMNVKVVLLPDGEDPDSYLQKVGSADFKKYIAEQASDFILFKTNLLLEEAGSDPIKKTKLVKDIVESIARIPDPIKRSLYVRECAGAVDVEEELLVMETNKMVTWHIRQKRQQQKREAIQQQRQAKNSPADDSFAGLTEPPQTAEHDTPPTEEAPTPSLGHEYRERDIVRILICAGGQHFDQSEELSVAAFVLSNIEEVIDEFENELYKRVAKDCLQRLLDKKEINQQYFITHPDDEIKNLAIDFLHPKDVYSENWKEKWDIQLQTQPMPELNFTKDSIKAINLFKLRKIIQLCNQNQERIKAAADQPDEMTRLLKVQQHLLKVRKELADELGGAVVIK